MATIRYQFPLAGGHINNPFKLGKHYGFDMVMSFPDVTLGQPVHSPATGRVVSKGFGEIMAYNYGNWVQLKMADGQYVFIAHMQSPTPLAVGAAVTIGQQIGHAGATGNVTGPHVHTAFMTASLSKGTSHDGAAYIRARLSASEASVGGTTSVPVSAPHLVPNGDKQMQVMNWNANNVIALFDESHWQEFHYTADMKPAGSLKQYQIDFAVTLAHCYPNLPYDPYAWKGRSNQFLLLKKPLFTDTGSDYVPIIESVSSAPAPVVDATALAKALAALGVGGASEADLLAALGKIIPTAEQNGAAARAAIVK